MHSHHPHLSEALLVHALVLVILLSAAVLGLLVAVKLFAPGLGSLLIGLEG